MSSTPLGASIKRRIGLWAGVAGLFCLGWSPGALADEPVEARKEPTPEERTLAAALFKEGRDLMEASKYSEACPKLLESYRLDPGGGTLLNVALCHAREGRHATAWVEFREAQAIAARDGRQDRVDAAEGEIQKLKPLLSYLSITVAAENNMPGFVVSIDGAAISKAAWGTPFPVDPGRHMVNAAAPEHAPYETVVEMGASAETKSIAVPKLARKVVAGKPPVVGGSAEPQGSGTRKVLGYTALGVGGVGVIVGSIFGIKALSAIKASNDACPDVACADPEAVDLSRDAKGFATVSNIGFGVGIVGIAAGTILILTAPKAQAKVGVSAAPGGVWISGVF